MASWQPLRDLLQGKNEVTLTWQELEALVGKLPPSAYNYQAYWSGERGQWAGFRAQPHGVGRSVTFVRHGASTTPPR